MFCFMCNARETGSDTYVLCDECLERELTVREQRGDIGPGFIRGPIPGTRYDFDTFIALLAGGAIAGGAIAVDLIAQAGMTREDAYRLALSPTRSEQRTQTRLLLMAQHVLAAMLQVAFPIQTALGVIWYPQQAGFDPSHDEIWRAAMDFVAAAVPWKVKDVAVQQELRRRAISEGRELVSVKQDELRTALLLALHLYTPEERQIRIGGQWYTVAPTELKAEYAWRWLCNETCKLAEESVRGSTRATVFQQTTRSGDALALLEVDEDMSMLSPGDDPLVTLLRQEEQETIFAVLHQSAIREREAVRLLYEGMNRSEVAAAMGITDSALRGLLYRFARKVLAA